MPKKRTNAAANHGVDKASHVYLVDGSTFIFRAYHALPPLSRKSDGLAIGAVHGFCNMLFKLLQDLADGDAPSHLGVVFDYSAKTFRSDLYKAYKAHRPEPPEDLIPQFALVRAATRAFNVACLEMENYEADDLIATYATQARNAGAKVTIVSSDKDLMQLIDDQVTMYDTMKDRTFDREAVIEKFGVPPEKVVEVQALAGDSVDNVPGVPGIGIKTAAQLIEDYGDVETLLQKADEIKQKKRRENLIEYADDARISRKLVTLDRDSPLPEPLSALAVDPPRGPDLIAFLKAMEFTTLTRRAADRFDVEDVSAVDPDPDYTAGSDSAVIEGPARGPDLDPSGEGRKTAKGKGGGEDTGHPPGAIPHEEAVRGKVKHDSYEILTTEDALEGWIAAAEDRGLLCIDTETNSLDNQQCDLVGIALALAPGKAAYIPFLHGADGLDFSGEGDGQLDVKKTCKKLKPLLENPAVLKVGQNLKFDMGVLKRYGIDLAPIDDTMLISYAIEAGLTGHGMDALSERHLGHTPIPFKEIAGSGKNQKTFDQIPVKEAARYAAEDADVTLRLHSLLKPKLVSHKGATIYETLERPMVRVLSDMEAAGIKVEREALSRLSHDFAQRMAALEAECHALAGESFKIGSPKQLGDILFNKMGLASTRKTKTGAQATGAEILEELAAQGHDLPARVLDWRQVSKLRSTYTEALQGYINPGTGRVHTSYSLAATTTGRLSSSDPNLQNIPIRTKEGRQIREAFVPEKGNVLISADYSQIELRVLAHMADIDALKKAFKDGLDIHAMTASEMFGVPIEGMDPMIRRKAKAINFGIIYGISAYGLSRQLSIPRGEAQDYITTYFERFPGIKDYMEDTKARCRKQGYVETLFGRRCHYPEINSKNPSQRGFMERAAINAPIQGSAADIIRRAMIRMPEALEEEKLDARMLLQVHDELVFEAPKEQAKTVIKVAKAIMGGAPAPVQALSVPLVVEANSGGNWGVIH